MNTNMHGRAILRIATSEGCYVYPGIVTGHDSSRMEFSATYHGDRDEFWVVHLDGTGNEIGRWNARTLHHIVWDGPAEKGAAG